ncbi:MULTISPECIES: penicillin-binding protein activator [unclassified Acinetobacter]|uniref:penicillin-binding protein activator n=1 Tax=unclassified Acinetobacter TaxID=196816 RepID=UPI001909D5F8|nr:MULTISPECIES: penicillin-binding protein activator [unclassified Acinetobacter]MBK0064824.1 penicillin-binding protein activator [Acinetobacter sp. S55]MBK0068506.1 penicillin-binding protein activator [Acinetobacter sp. S54]
MLNNKKRLLLVCFAAFISQAQAEVLVILPESGPMARAASSIKSGFMSAYALSEDKVPLKFVNSDKQNIKNILARNVNKKTQLIVGPLAKSEIEQMVALNPKVRVLALNEIEMQSPNVIQFSLAKQDDAYALKQILLKDKISQLFVLRQTGREQESELYLMSIMTQLGESVQMVHDAPKKLKKGQGLLLLGDDAWVNQLSNLPKNNVYAQPTTIEENQPIPEGLKFCDVPALYEHKWNDVAHAYLQQPVSMPYQRLIAFGADAWMLAELYLKTPKIQNFTLEGRTGDLDVNSQRVTRIPHCYQKQKNTILQL